MFTSELALRPEEAASDESIKALLKKQLGLSSNDQLYFSIHKRSIDARGRDVKIRLKINYAVNENLALPESDSYRIEKKKLQNVSNAEPVAIIGCGPAGMFAALRLIELGLKPVIIERGKNIKDRRRDLAIINKQGIVNENSNYCFGEGGAGTYSDGKLYTRSNKRGNIQQILHTFIEFGASPDIAIDAHPHIGTNKLPKIIEQMREAILVCGGEILFNTKFEGFNIEGGKITGIKISNFQPPTSDLLPLTSVILATGHSARDVFEYFAHEKISIEAKPFALGVRIEHPQQIIDAAQYHCEVRSEFLPPSSYSMVNQSLGKGVYSFCMCPGGIIAPAATAPGEIVVNGWSPSRRNNPFANSGIVVSVDEKDFAKYAKHGALAALQYQRIVEQKSYEAGGGDLKAPAQRMVDFVNRKTSASLPKCSYIPGVTSTDLYEVLPPEISAPLNDALKEFGKKMKGYFTNEAVLVATESRTSSPIRIPRDNETLMHPQLQGLFPCGEGAGYAGGIVSAAIDGERCAEKVVEYLAGK
ncbi:MAG: FAD-dependent protein [Bacteroidia bacterium]